MTRKSQSMSSSKKTEQRKSRTLRSSTRASSADNQNNEMEPVNLAVNSNLPITNAFKVMMNTHRRQSTQSDKPLDSVGGLSNDGLKRRLDEDTSLQLPMPVALSAELPVEQHSHKRFKRSNGANSPATIIQWRNILTESNVTNIEIVDENTVESCAVISESSVSLCSNGFCGNSSDSRLDIPAKSNSVAVESALKTERNRKKSKNKATMRKNSTKVLNEISETSDGANRRTSTRKSNKKETSSTSQKISSDQKDTNRTPGKRERKSKLMNKNAKKERIQRNALDEIKSSDVIEIDDDTRSSDNCLKLLAPVFIRSTSANNETEDKKRNNFLYSNVPFEISSQSKQESNSEFKDALSERDNISILFPRISHIKQIDENSTFKWISPSLSSLSVINNCNLLWPDIYTMEKSELESDTIFSKICEQRCTIFSDITVPDLREKVNRLIVKNGLKPSVLNIIEDKPEIVMRWKKIFEPFPTFKCFNQMYIRYMHITGNKTDLQQQISYNNIRQENEVVNHLPSTVPLQYNGQELFIEKYKATVFEEMLINIGPVIELQKFLSKWRTDHSNNKKMNAKKSCNMSWCNDDAPYANTVALVGPISSGKTTAVYALAKSMNFNVLEINASMIRNGKRLIQDLHESTQSHQVHKTKVMGNSKKTIDTLWSKMKCKKSTTSQTRDINDAEKDSNGAMNGLQSLLLIEDADVLLDKFDIGFLEAVHTLSSKSKRPVIIVVNDKNCACLQKFANIQKINFHTPQPMNAAKYMCILSLVENCPLPLYDCLDLYCYNNYDLRRTLHQMHFFIQSRGDYHTKDDAKKILSNISRKSQIYRLKNRVVDNCVEPFEGTNLNTHSSLLKYFVYDMRTSNMLTIPIYLRLVSRYLSLMLQEYANQPSSKLESKQLNDTLNLHGDSLSLTKICHLYNNLSTASSLIGRNTIMLNVEKNINVYNTCVDVTDHTTTDILPSITQYLITNSLQVLLQANPEESVYAYNPENDRYKKRFIHEELNMMQGLYSSRSLQLDYEPCLRAICRSEFKRAQSERSCTRFYHYLQAYTKNMYTSCKDMYQESCLVLQ